MLLHTEGGCQRVTSETILLAVGYSCSCWILSRLQLGSL